MKDEPATVPPKVAIKPVVDGAVEVRRSNVTARAARAPGDERRVAFPSTRPPEQPSSAVLDPALANATARGVPPPIAAAPPPATPIPKTRKAPDQDAMARFFPIPQNPAAGVGPVLATERQLHLDKDIGTLNFVPARENNLDVQSEPEREYRIRTKSSSVLVKPVEVAKLKYGKREITFDWGKNIQNEVDSISEVLDSLLAIRCRDGEIQYVLFRTGIRDEPGALPLRLAYRQGFQAALVHEMDRGRRAPVEQDGSFSCAVAHVAVRLGDEPGTIVAESKVGAAPTSSDGTAIIPEELSLKIRLAEKDPGEIHVRHRHDPSIQGKPQPAGTKDRRD